MKKVKNISLILLVLALLIIGSSSIVVTNENEYSLIRQFGKVDHVVSSAGVTLRFLLYRASISFRRRSCSMICLPPMSSPVTRRP